MRQQFGKLLRKTLSFLCLSFLLIAEVACSKSEESGENEKATSETKVVLTTGFSKDEVFRIDDISCTLPEAKIYLSEAGRKYVRAFDSDILSKDFDGVTIEESLRSTVLARLSRIKALNLMARDEGVSLTEDERAMCVKAGKEYFDLLSDEELLFLDTSLDTITAMYEEYALADKLYEYLIKDINPEISDDEARLVTVSHILIRNDSDDARERAERIKEEIMEDFSNFESLMLMYNESSENEIVVARGERNPEFEEACFSLDIGAVSDIIETDEGYEIIKCIRTSDAEEIENNKIATLEKRRKTVFEERYDEFIKGLTKNLNEVVWEEINLGANSSIVKAPFFEIFDRNYTVSDDL